MDRRVSRQVGPGASDADGVAHTAEFVNQSDVEGVAAGPHPAAGDVVDLRNRATSALRNLRHEVVVEPVNDGRQPLALVIAEASSGGEHQRSGAVRNRSRVQPHPVE